MLPKQTPIPDELTGPFYKALNEGKLVVQSCNACNKLQHPPKPVCAQEGCGSSDLTYKEVSGRGTIYNYGVVFDCPIRVLQEEQPFNVAVGTIEEDDDIQFYSHLPGTPVDDVPVGGAVQAVFEDTAGGDQKIIEWKVV